MLPSWPSRWISPTNILPPPGDLVLIYTGGIVELGTYHPNDSPHWLHLGANRFESADAPDFWCPIPPLPAPAKL